MADDDEISKLRAEVASLRAIVERLGSPNSIDFFNQPIIAIKDLGSGKFQQVVPNAAGTGVDLIGVKDDVGTGYSRLLNISDLDVQGAYALVMRFAGGHRILKLGSGKGTLTPIKVLSPGSGTTTATDSWALASDKKAVSCDVMMRAGYDSTAHKFYNVTRLFTEDSNGNLASISAETLNYFVTLVTGGCT